MLSSSAHISLYPLCHVTNKPGAVLPLVRKFPYCKEISPFGTKKEGNENCKEKEGNFEASKELKRNSRNKLYVTVSGAKTVLAGY